MASMKDILKTGCLFIGALAALGVVALLVLAFFGKKPAPFGQRLAALPPAERNALNEALEAAGLKIADLRDVGRGAGLDYPANARSVAIEEGHVWMLSLQTECKPLPSLSALTELEQLSLKGAHLTALPDLSGCAHLETLDASKNQIAAVLPGTLPAGLRILDLSENPLSDLAPLAVLTAPAEIHVRKAAVTSFDALIDLPLPLLDLRDNPITRLPERFPKSPDFRVDLEGCPAYAPPGYLKDWHFTIKESGVVGGVQTSDGAIQQRKSQATGTWREVPHLTSVSLQGDGNASIGAVDLEVSVEQGKLRVYLSEAGEPRGPWFEKGFVKGTGGIHLAAKIYADAEPGKPARMHGNLEHFAGQPYSFYIEPLDGKPAIGMKYRVWRE